MKTGQSRTRYRVQAYLGQVKRPWLDRIFSDRRDAFQFQRKLEQKYNRVRMWKIVETLEYDRSYE